MHYWYNYIITFSIILLRLIGFYISWTIMISRRLQLSHGVRADTAGYCVLFQLAVHVLRPPVRQPSV